MSLSNLWNRLLVFLQLRKPPTPLVSMAGSLQQIAAHEHLEKETIITSPSIVYKLPSRKPVRFSEFSELQQTQAQIRAEEKRRARKIRNIELVFKGGVQNVTANCNQHAEIVTEQLIEGQLADSEKRNA